MVPDHWSNDAMVSMDRHGLDDDDGGDFPPLNIISGGLAKDGDAEDEEHSVVLAQEMMKKGI